MGNFQSLDLQSFADKQINEEDWFRMLSMTEEKVKFYKDFNFGVLQKIAEKNPDNIKTIISNSIKFFNKLFEQHDFKYVDFGINVVRIATKFIGYCQGRDELSQLLWRESIKSEIKSDETTTTSDSDSLPKAEQSMAVDILLRLTFLLFYPGICIPDHLEFDMNNASLLWGKRVGKNMGKTGTSSDYYMDSNRAEILKCLIVCLAGALTKKQVEAPVVEDGLLMLCAKDEWIENFLDAKKNKIVRTLFYSLTNTLCSYSFFEAKFFGKAFKDLYASCLHLFIILLEYRKYSFDEATTIFEDEKLRLLIESQPVELTQKSSKGHNIFRDCFLEKSFSLFFSELFTAIEKIIEASRFKNKSLEENFVNEALLLFWKLIDESNDFMKFFFETDYSRFILLLIKLLNSIFCAQVNVGMINLILLIFLKLSAKREFGISLNNIYRWRKYRIPELSNFENFSFADILYIFLNQVIVNCIKMNKIYDASAMFSSVIGILINVAPYVSKINLSSSVALMSIFEIFLKRYRRSIHQSNEISCRQQLESVLKFFSYFIQYQFKGSSNLVYAIIHKSHLFVELFNFQPKAFRPPDHPSEDNQKNLNFERAELRKEESEKDKGTKEKINNSSESGSEGEMAVESTGLIAASEDTTGNGAEEMKDVENDIRKALMSSICEKIDENNNERESKKKIKNLKDYIQKTRDHWMQNKDLCTLIRLIEYLFPKVENLCKEDPEVDQIKVFAYIESCIVVGILPTPDGVVIKDFKSSVSISNWISRLLWKVILDEVEQYQLIDFDVIRMFEIVRIER